MNDDYVHVPNGLIKRSEIAAVEMRSGGLQFLGIISIISAYALSLVVAIFALQIFFETFVLGMLTEDGRNDPLWSIAFAIILFGIFFIVPLWLLISGAKGFETGFKNDFIKLRIGAATTSIASGISIIAYWTNPDADLSLLDLSGSVIVLVFSLVVFFASFYWDFICAHRKFKITLKSGQTINLDRFDGL